MSHRIDTQGDIDFADAWKGRSLEVTNISNERVDFEIVDHSSTSFFPMERDDVRALRDWLNNFLEGR